MKIEKKKVSEQSKWNAATKSGLAALMGLTAAASMVACATSGDPAGPEGEDITGPDDQKIIDADSSDSVAPEQNKSSSSQVVVDIPKSSSSVNMELLSSASMDTSLSAGVIPPYEIINDILSSSSLESSSSSESSSSAESSSSSVESSSSEKTDFCDLNPQSPLCPCDSNVQICPDPDDPENMIVSMVTTFERTDIDV